MQAWQPDRFLPGFESLELEFPDDYDGRALATLVRLPYGGEAPRGSALFLHGFCDYFFQRHMAERFAMEGYAFYALDLRKHGGSLRPHQHPNFCKSVAEYYPEITRSIDVIGEPVLLAGHSTGGLVCSLCGSTARSSTGTSPTGAARSSTWRRRLAASSHSSTIPKRCCRITRRRCSTRAGNSTPR